MSALRVKVKHSRNPKPWSQLGPRMMQEFSKPDNASEEDTCGQSLADLVVVDCCRQQNLLQEEKHTVRSTGNTMKKKNASVETGWQTCSPSLLATSVWSEGEALNAKSGSDCAASPWTAALTLHIRICDAPTPVAAKANCNWVRKGTGRGWGVRKEDWKRGSTWQSTEQ